MLNNVHVRAWSSLIQPVATHSADLLLTLTLAAASAVIVPSVPRWFLSTNSPSVSESDCSCSPDLVKLRWTVGTTNQSSSQTAVFGFFHLLASLSI